MRKYREYEKRTEELVVPICDTGPYELVDVEFVKEAGSWHLRIYMDKEGGITLDDLTDINHQVSDLLDKNDFIDESYILEVSSPGLLRPFKKPKDFLRNIGNDVEVKLFSPIVWEENNKKYSDKEFVGILQSYEEETGTLVIAMNDVKLELAVKDIALIRKNIDF